MNFNLKLLCLCGILLFSNAAFTQTFRTFNKPVVFDEERKQLSIEYLKVRHGIVQDSATIVPKMIVLHWTAIPTLEQSFDAMNPSVLPGARKGIAGASSLNVAAQFLVDRDGMIFRQLPETAFARHVIGLNYCAIGVENVGGSNALLTDAQLDANEALIRYLKKKYKIEYVIGHHEYQSFIGHPLFKETDPNYLTVKSDPGDEFMNKIRERIKDLDIKGAIKK
ncbi:N-acetylmuramoyl-L-alanine amidase [Daejeonella rubra]|uniref:N-acetylmuramoyl-L-alanine amidase n=1 Tax=Daejeonella rubra TaxID=990371 RepID=A0A1G9SK47_9SPHI|nr:peptidoglycan recognition family protein [Daejeonella rubra]SDM35175.1 N-acetylmuramoyl-L-alanine amidase [Daejeonella rubra]